MSDHTEHDELAALRAIGSDVAIEPVAWESPPADLWDRIAAEAGIGVEPATPARPRIEPTPVTTPEPPSPGSPGGGGSVIPFRSRRQVPWFLAAAAALVVIAGVVAVAVRGGGDPDSTLLASSTLDRLGPASEEATGTAELVEVDGELQLRIDVSGLDESDGFHEVWIIDPAVSQLISLGPIRSDGLYDLPAGIDPEAFPIVDVSIEPLDGDPTHSGNSVLRGQLTF